MKYYTPYHSFDVRTGPCYSEGNFEKYAWNQYPSFWMNVPKKNKHYRVYLSRRANAYKKYHGKVKKAIENGHPSSVAAHGAWLTRELKDVQKRFKDAIFEQCNELLAKQ